MLTQVANLGILTQISKGILPDFLVNAFPEI